MTTREAMECPDSWRSDVVRLWHDWSFVFEALRRRQLTSDAAKVCEAFLEDVEHTFDIQPRHICNDCMNKVHESTQLPQLLVRLTALGEASR